MAAVKVNQILKIDKHVSNREICKIDIVSKSGISCWKYANL
jgi:hypothetical protein